MTTRESAERDTQLVLDTFRQLGLHLNFGKSSLTPEHTKAVYRIYLVRTVNSDCQAWLEIPSDRIRSLRHDICRLLKAGTCTGSACAIARVAGQCVSTCKVILPSKLLLRSLYRLLKIRRSWQYLLVLDSETIKDLQWWLQALKTWNGEGCFPDDDRYSADCRRLLQWLRAHMEGRKAMGFWNARMSQEHCNYRELTAFMMAILSYAPQLQGHTVQLLSDNITAIAYLNNLGGSQKSVSHLATAIWAECYRLGIQLHSKHFAGCRNTLLADQPSRTTFKYEWMLHPTVFRRSDRLLGPHVVDCFASMATAQIPVYNSLHFDPHSSGARDALAQTNWGNMNNYVNAPFRLIPRVLDLLQSQQAVGTIIATWWSAQVWFQRLQRMSLTPPLRLLLSRHTVQAINPRAEPLMNPRWAVYVWRVSGRTGPEI